ncbi:MAG: DUF3854 domain-containing protein [Elainella sp. Prado103]|nr:DUF3854 domain-containing protein [Elainella sp. Prado103]
MSASKIATAAKSTTHLASWKADQSQSEAVNPAVSRRTSSVEPAALAEPVPDWQSLENQSGHPAGKLPVSAWITHVAPDHAAEWLASGVDPEIIALNVETLTDTAIEPTTDRLFPIAERLNWSINRFGVKTRPALRGWWVSGRDPFTGQRMDWGRFKPDIATPILDYKQQKFAKYLSPRLGPGSSRLVLLDVPVQIWQRVAQRYQTSVPEDQTLGFWEWVKQNQIPIVLTEGEKKAGCLLTLGYAAIALPGVFTGYRRQTGQLIPDLAIFATPDRPVYICFDFETRPKTRQQIQLATTRLGQLLDRSGCNVQVITLPGSEKGVDDFVMAQGAAAFHQQYQRSTRWIDWQVQQQWGISFPIARSLNQPYLADLTYPETGIVGIKSPKGTGKTTALQPLIQQAIQTERPVLVITHRVQLGRAICSHLGLTWIEALQHPPSQPFNSDSLGDTQALLGYGLCVDSLHPLSQARFNPQLWQGAIVIIDEVEQVLWHVLNSSTCYEHRVKILETLRELIQTITASGGLLILQDADLSDLSLNYFLSLTEEPILPWIVVNQWQPPQYPVWFYDTPNPTPLLDQLLEIAETGAVFISMDSQKVQGRWSSRNLESFLSKRLPHKQILRIDSETVTDPNHAAYQIADRLNQAIAQYDIVLATPTIGTGVSIDLPNHFQAVFGIFQGVIPDPEVRQALARIRSPIPRFVWAARFGNRKIGNGSCHYQEIVTSTLQSVKYNINLLKMIDFDLDQSTDPITLRTWAKMAARVNYSLWNFRQQLAQTLQLEGHELETLTADRPSSKVEKILTELTTVQQENRLQDAIAIVTATEIPSDEYETLKDRQTKTWKERCAIQKYELQKRYSIPLTSEIKLKDDDGWFSQLRLHYYLTHPIDLVHRRDRKEWQNHLERGEGKVILHDIRFFTAQVEALKSLGISALLDPNREIRATDPDVVQIAQHCIRYQRDIKTVLNLTLSEKMTPIAMIQSLLSKLGLKLTCIRRDQASNGKRGGLRVYQYQPPQDQRAEIFASWQARDQEVFGLDTSDRTPNNDPPPDIERSIQSTDGLNDGSNRSSIKGVSQHPSPPIQHHSSVCFHQRDRWADQLSERWTDQ